MNPPNNTDTREPTTCPKNRSVTYTASSPYLSPHLLSAEVTTAWNSVVVIPLGFQIYIFIT